MVGIQVEPPGFVNFPAPCSVVLGRFRRIDFEYEINTEIDYKNTYVLHMISTQIFCPHLVLFVSSGGRNCPRQGEAMTSNTRCTGLRAPSTRPITGDGMS